MFRMTTSAMRIGYLLKKRVITVIGGYSAIYSSWFMRASYTKSIDHAPFMWSTITMVLPFAHAIDLTWRKCFTQNIFFISSTVCRIHFLTSIKKQREKYNLILEYCKEQLSESSIPDGVVTSHSKHSTWSGCSIYA